MRGISISKAVSVGEVRSRPRAGAQAGRWRRGVLGPPAVQDRYSRRQALGYCPARRARCVPVARSEHGGCSAVVHNTYAARAPTGSGPGTMQQLASVLPVQPLRPDYCASPPRQAWRRPLRSPARKRPQRTLRARRYVTVRRQVSPCDRNKAHGMACSASLVSVGDVWGTWAVISSCAALGIRLENTVFGRAFSGPVCAMLLCAIVTNLGVLPTAGAPVSGVQALVIKLATPCTPCYERTVIASCFPAAPSRSAVRQRVCDPRRLAVWSRPAAYLCIDGKAACLLRHRDPGDPGGCLYGLCSHLISSARR
eukprot:scaffold1229_cov400-Prasinococcus_capsulatus_cf.AAC.3